MPLQGMQGWHVAYYHKLQSVSFKNYKPFFKGSLDRSGRYLKIILERKDDKQSALPHCIDLESKNFEINQTPCDTFSPRYVYQHQNSIYDTQRKKWLTISTKQQFEAPYMYIHDDCATALCLRGGSCLYPQVEVSLYSVQPFKYRDALAEYPYYSVSWMCLSSDKKIAVILLNDKEYSRLDFYDLTKKRDELDYLNELAQLH